MTGFDWSKLAGLLAIAAGFGVLYVPPTMLGAGAGTVAFATTLITAGFATLGVPLVAGIVEARARGARAATIRENRSAAARAGVVTRRARRTPPDEGIDLSHRTL